MEDNNSTVVCFEKKGNYQDISLDYNSTHGGNDNPDKTFKKAFNNVFNIPEQNLEDDNNTEEIYYKTLYNDNKFDPKKLGYESNKTRDFKAPQPPKSKNQPQNGNVTKEKSDNVATQPEKNKSKEHINIIGVSQEVSNISKNYYKIKDNIEITRNFGEIGNLDDIMSFKSDDASVDDNYFESYLDVTLLDDEGQLYEENSRNLFMNASAPKVEGIIKK